MSNTGRSKRLASFNCHVELWEKFTRQCRENDTTATAVLTKFISHYLNNSLDELAVSLGKVKESGSRDWEQRIKTLVDEYLEQRLPDYLDKYSSPQFSPRPSRQNKVTKEEKDFWFVKERAKYLDIAVTAAQVLHIELFANEAYKERHDALPKRQLFRNTQSFAYPKNDVDILDKAIKKVTGM